MGVGWKETLQGKRTASATRQVMGKGELLGLGRGWEPVVCDGWCGDTTRGRTSCVAQVTERSHLISEIRFFTY